MKYTHFIKIHGGKYPIIRVSYKTWFGKKRKRDVCREGNNFVWMDTGEWVIKDTPLKAFLSSRREWYDVNGI